MGRATWCKHSRSDRAWAFPGPAPERLAECARISEAEQQRHLADAAPLRDEIGVDFYFKNDGQNPSASFKDRGMASALSYINALIRQGTLSEVLAVCASTGDTSAAAALYASYLKPRVKSAVLLPRGKVTPQQLSQPLGSGATVFEIPGVFDDCMKVVEALSENYPVALLNSKNSWRILGQESYSYEIAQDFEYEVGDLTVVVPIGNAGNITAVMSGFLKFFEAGVIAALPKVIGVQSRHADPVCRYYHETRTERRHFVPVTVRPSVAQAAMIGNPVSMPRVTHLVERYHQTAGRERVFFVDVSEQDIMDRQLAANRSGHVACTHGGETLAGLIAAHVDLNALVGLARSTVARRASPLVVPGTEWRHRAPSRPAQSYPPSRGHHRPTRSGPRHHTHRMQRQ